MDDFRHRVLVAIHSVQARVSWKPGKAQQHLRKRKLQGHLPPDATLTEYETIIRAVVSDPKAVVYVFRFGGTDYPTVVTAHRGRAWLVMFDLHGTMETAFPPDDAGAYVENEPRYIPIGVVEEFGP